MSNITSKAFRIAEKKPAKITLGVILALSLLAATVVPLYLIYTSRNQANAYLDGFDPGNIMSDFVMGNKNTMTEAQVNDFLHSKNPCNKAYDDEVKYWQGQGYIYGISGNRVLCMADDKFDGESAAHIIWQAAQDYSINPQVLIVLLEKEQSLVTDPWPNHRQYASATGFGCPDTGGCDPKGAGFKNQIRKAAALFREVLDGGWSNYPAYTTQFIYYNPNTGCGGTNIYIQNRATSALYRYTPYQPNAAALAAGTGTGDSCSSYGNRNFYNLFTNWFGDTRSYNVRGGILEGYNEVGGYQALGSPTMNEDCSLKDGWCYQIFEKGTIYWSEKTGSHNMHGGIRDKWASLGYEWGWLGFPTSNEIGGLKGGGVYQSFENGVMYYTDATGANTNRGAIRDEYAKYGYENGLFGYPIGDEVCGLKDNGCYQSFQGGRLYWTSKLGSMNIYGGIGDKWSATGYENGTLGYPIGDEVCAGAGCSRRFENGAIYWNNTTGTAYYTSSKMAEEYTRNGTVTGYFGYPTMDEKCGLVHNGCYQMLQNGNSVAYYSKTTGFHIVHGGVKDIFSVNGYEWSLGLPISDEIRTSNGVKQEFERATIYWSDTSYFIQYK